MTSTDPKITPNSKDEPVASNNDSDAASRIRRIYEALEAERKEEAELQRKLANDVSNREARGRLITFVATIAASGILIHQFFEAPQISLGGGVLASLRGMDGWSRLAVLSSALALAAAAVVTMIAYLNRSDRPSQGFPTSKDLRRQLYLLQKSVDRLQMRSTSGAGPEGPQPRDELADEAFRQKIVEEVSSKLKDELSERAQNARHLKNIRRLHESSHERLFQEINALNQRAKLNLAIGIVITLIAAAILFYIAISEPPSLQTAASLATHYVPRLSTVIFVEVFAFFFLKLYKSALSDIREYQQDITRLNRESTAVDLTFFSGDDKDRSNIAQSLIANERSCDAAERTSSSAIDPKLIGDLTTIISKIVTKGS